MLNLYNTTMCFNIFLSRFHPDSTADDVQQAMAKLGESRPVSSPYEDMTIT